MRSSRSSDNNPSRPTRRLKNRQSPRQPCRAGITDLGCLVESLPDHDETDQPLTNRRIRESEARLHALVESLDEAAAEFDRCGRVLNVWTTHESLLPSKDFMLGKTLAEIVGEQEARPYLEVFSRVLETGRPENMECSIVAHGHKRWGLARVSPIRSANGPCESVCLLVRDITDRRRAETELQRLAAIVQNSANFVSIADLELNVLFVNGAGQALMELSAEDVRRTKMTDYFFPEDHGMVLNQVLPIVRIQGRWTGEGLLRSIKSGRAIPVIWDVFRIDDPSKGEPINFATVIRDITERKEAERTLEHREATIRAMFQTSRALNATLDVDAILSSVALETVQMIGAEFACAGIRDELSFRSNWLVNRATLKRIELSWPLPGVVSDWLLNHKVPYLNNSADADVFTAHALRSHIRIRQAVCLPILDVHAEVIAFVGLLNKGESGFASADIENLEVVAQIASSAIQNALAYQKLGRAERELRRLSSNLIRTQDLERRRIARELHDQTVQSLSAVTMNLKRLAATNGHLSSDLHFIVDESL